MKIKNNLKYKLTLNKNELKWLKETVQNPIGCTTEEEDPEHKKFRKSFWDTLNSFVLKEEDCIPEFLESKLKE